MEFIDVHSIFKDNLVISFIPNYFINSETLIICYKNNKPIRSTIFNVDINIEFNTPDNYDCQNSNYLYPTAGHVITGNLNVIPGARGKNLKKYHASCQNVCDALTFLLDNIFIQFGTRLFRQVVRIPMGTNCAPLAADLFLLVMRGAY